MKRTKQTRSVMITVDITAEDCPAKTWIATGEVLPGRSVKDHCLIVGAIAKELIRLFPPQLKDLFPEGAALIAAAHDIGKLSPSFFLRIALQTKSPKLATRAAQLLNEIGFPKSPQAIRDYESAGWGGHPGISYVTVKKMTGQKRLAIIVGQHHGYLPKSLENQNPEQKDFGGPLWEKEREKLVEDLGKTFKEQFPKSISISQMQLLSGLTTVADWLGSGEFFDDPSSNWKPLVSPSIKEAGFISLTITKDLAFGDIFRDMDGTEYEPTEAQKALASIASSPGVYILEAPMGAGKTEAALFASYLALSTGRARGIYFALPTQLTATKIYERFCSFLNSVVPGSSLPRLLFAGADAFFESQNMGRGEAAPGGSWFSGKKRGLLAPFAVGTLDQALLSIMGVKHNFVRTFGLAGKVIIIDEVHSYDAYTSYLLQKLIETLNNLCCTVILLSATLTSKTRESLLQGAEIKVASYPQISYRRHSGETNYICLPALKDRTIKVSFLSTKNAEQTAIEEVLVRACGGQQIIWIENDVASSQRIYLELAARCAELHCDCGLLHSHFTFSDRQKIENTWVPYFDKSGRRDRNDRGRVLVGTQILEQSLDLDADFMVSRIAPADLLFQRLGRLWRHKDTIRPAAARAEIWILSPNLQAGLEKPYQFFGASAYVYSPYTLCRTIEVFQDKHELNIPSDIPAMVESALKERNENGLFAVWKDELENGDKCHHRIGIRELVNRASLQIENPESSSFSIDDSTAQTRYSNIPTVDVLLVEEVEPVKQSSSTILHTLDGEKIKFPWKYDSLTPREWCKIAAETRSCTVKLPLSQAHELKVPFERAKKLGFGNFRYLTADDKAGGLYLALCSKEGAVTTELKMCLKHDIIYSSKIGWYQCKENNAK
ncbi:MAG: CRISPR-associated helicase Cas3' [Mesosutterella sp.]|nr:CRISPR-associated helicase Cas3' [Mesosutterella sp.]